MCLTHEANRFVNCAESLLAYRVQCHSCSQNLHVKAGSGMAHFAFLKGFKFWVFEVCWSEFFEKIKVVINCVTRLYQTKLNCFDFKTSFGPNNSRKFGFESFWRTMFENRYLMLGLYYQVICVFRRHQS